MRLFGKIKSIQGNHVSLDLDKDLDMTRVAKYAKQQVPIAELSIQDKRSITPLQRRKLFAMFGDISRWSGYAICEAEQWMKAYYIVTYGVDYFSLSDTSESNASHFIDYVIKFCFKFGVPFKHPRYVVEDYEFQRQALLHRQCLIDGRRSEIDHWTNTVGAGRNRRKIDNTKFGFTSLCHNCHMERHQIGKHEFEQKYHIHIIPIHLTHDEIKKLHIGG